MSGTDLPVLVLCGGRGTRLPAPIKCLTPILGRPFMDYKLDQLERLGATRIDLICGPYRRDFKRRYGKRVMTWADPQLGIRNALGTWDGWWTWGDTLLEQAPAHPNACYVAPGVHIAGLWIDAGLYHGRGPWTMVEATDRPHHINTLADLARTEAYLADLSRHR